MRYEELTGKDGKDASCIIVLYYQAGDSEAADDEDAMEWSTVKEVKKWIKESNT